jgi:hypothetical protein
MRGDRLVTQYRSPHHHRRPQADQLRRAHTIAHYKDDPRLRDAIVDAMRWAQTK